MNFKNPKIEKVYEYLSQMSCRAYADPFLISNVVLCKQDVLGRVLETCLSGELPQILRHGGVSQEAIESALGVEFQHGMV